jgi:hypothetical protein
MPRYVVVDSQNKWLEIGEYDTPEEAMEGGRESGDFIAPSRIYVYEIAKEIQFTRNMNGNYTKDL